MNNARFYFIYGIRRISELVVKAPVEMAAFKFPKDAVYHYLDTSNPDSLYPDTSIGFLNYGVKLPLYIPEQKPDVPYLRLIPSKLASIQNEIRSNKDLRIQTELTRPVSSNIPIIVDHQVAMHSVVKRGSAVVTHYELWSYYHRHMFTSGTFGVAGRTNYLFIQPDTNIPKLSFIKDRLLKESSSRVINKYLHTSSAYWFLEFVRYAYGSTKNVPASVFSTIDSNTADNTVLVLRNDTKFILLKLSTLFTWLSDKRSKNTTINRLAALFIRLADNITIDDDEEDIGAMVNAVLVNSTSPVSDGKEVVNKVEPNNPTEETADGTTVLMQKVTELKSTGMVSAATVKAITNGLKKQETMKSPFSNNKLKEDLVISDKELTLTDEEIKVPLKDGPVDKTMLRDVVGPLDKKYIKIMHKDLARAIYSIQSNGILVEDVKTTETTKVTGNTITYEIKVRPIRGKVSTIKMVLPKVESNGEFTISGTTYRMRKLRTDVPIRKISNDRVALTTYYGRLFIDRAIYKRMDYGYWVAAKVLKMSGVEGSNIKSAISNSVGINVPGLPLKYTSIARYLRKFKYKDEQYTFSYKKRDTIFPNTDIKKIEIKNTVLVGKKGNTPIVMSKHGSLFTVNNKDLVPHIGFTEMLGLDPSKEPGNPIHLKLLGEIIPVGILLSYYLGLDALLRDMRIRYRLQSNSRGIDWDKENIIRLQGDSIVYTRTNDYRDIILSGIATYKKVHAYSIEDLNSKDTYVSLLSGGIVRKMESLENNFIDPISLDVLKSMGEPTTFHGLLKRSAELLETDYHPHPQDLDYMLIKGYERMPGMVYTQLVKAVEEFDRKNMLGKAALNIDPFEVMNTIKGDSSVSLVEDINPIGTLKQTEEVTYLGVGGRSRETMSKNTRYINTSDIGVISELSKDSGDVGITSYMSASPNIRNVRGIKAHNFDIKTDGGGALFSTSALLAPAAENDDPKRIFFIGIHNSHTIPVAGQEQAKVRTGYDYVLPYRVGERYVYIAEQDGVVKSLGAKNIVITYKDGTTVKRKIGDVNYSRPISNIAYIEPIGTLLKKGDSFKKGDIITYNTSFFERDWMYPDRIVYKNTSTGIVALVESNPTYEDGSVVIDRYTNKLTTEMVKVTSNIIDTNMTISDVVSPGDSIDSGSPLFIAFSNFTDTGGLDKEVLESLRENTRLSINSPYKGTVVHMECFYNDEYENMSDSVQAFINKTNTLMSTSLGKKVTGQVGAEYSVSGKPLAPGSMEIKVYIRNTEPFGTGDKIVIGNQLKCTASEVLDADIRTEDDIPVDIIFGDRSQFARIVLSAMLQGSTNLLLTAIANEAIKAYEG